MDRVTYALIARVPSKGVADFQAYEEAVLPLLGEHDGRLDRRVRSRRHPGNPPARDPPCRRRVPRRGGGGEVRNEARVHLWYERKFGVPCPPYPSTEAAIASFPSTSSCFGVRPDETGLQVYAPYGFTDLFAFRARPNPVLAPRHVYEAKKARWRQEWPQLQVLPWLGDDPGLGPSLGG